MCLLYCTCVCLFPCVCLLAYLLKSLYNFLCVLHGLLMHLLILSLDISVLDYLLVYSLVSLCACLIASVLDHLMFAYSLVCLHCCFLECKDLLPWFLSSMHQLRCGSFLLARLHGLFSCILVNLFVCCYIFNF